MALRDIIKEIQKLTTAEQLLIKDFFIKSLASYSASEPIFKDISEQKHKDGYTCTHCHSTNVVHFGKYRIKAGAKGIHYEYPLHRCLAGFQSLCKEKRNRALPVQI